MKLRRGRNMRPRPATPPRPPRTEPVTVEQLSEQDADRVGRMAYYGGTDCLDGKGSVIGWEKLTPERRDYYIGIAACVLVEHCLIRGVEVIVRRPR
ncbi:hypothetical protein [Amycolatopsis taiwanensis]|uniref:hypothetical protein n=1 Tax=Amycolatopsis taiwanensis TaxID=342230 RepID=UPI0004B6799C|nr:hypothetical protein [Amycolatopsis taiwanensis]